MPQNRLIQPGIHYLQGSQACVEGAIIAGCRVYGGYPITPASEVMEHAAKRIPQVGGRFIQMEDEIASACILLGASWGGAKAMTATSSPGFSLMQETISYGIMSETPLVIVDVQRPGPGQGYVTTSQEDVMQARWGHHGEGSIIALAPASVQEMFEFTIEAFNLSEKWRTPVLLMAEETVAHMRERLIVPPLEDIKIDNRKKPQDLGIAPENYLPWGHDAVAPMANWGEGYNVNLIGLVHLEDGNVTKYDLNMHDHCVHLDNCKHLVICYGSVSRTAIEAVTEARNEHNLEIGYLRLKTLWPFPEKKLRSLIKKVDAVFVPEMNLGMMKHPVAEALGDRCQRIISIPSLGSLHTPEYILSVIHEELK